MKRIPLSQGKFALVDDEDYERLSQSKWQATHHRNTWYAMRKGRHPTEGWKRPITIKIHREILGLVKGDGKQVDHINHDGLDNRKVNLRLCTNQENQRNRGATKNAASKYKGVIWNKGENKWNATITVQGKRYRLGYFKDEIEAAKAYDTKAIELFGDFANPNFPKGETI